MLDLLILNLSSSDGEVRELCLHSVLLLLPLLGPQVGVSHSVLCFTSHSPSKVTKTREETQLSLQGLVQTLLDAEKVPETLHNYKDKLNLLERCDYSRVSEVLELLPSLALLPVHYMLGLLHTNFTLLWKPLSSLLTNYGTGMSRDLFWPVFVGRLRSAAEDVKTEVGRLQEGREREGKVDHINYRNQLWGLMAGFPRMAEAKNRDLVPLLLDTFMTEEYTKIRQLSDQTERLGQGSQETAVVKSTIRSLLAHLAVFAKFHDLKSLHRGAELRHLVYSLLCHKLAPVQKVSMEILVAFKLKFLLPYKDNLLRLLEEKDFKAELLAFPLGGEDTLIKPEHREELLPIILRILYGRMRAKKSGKAAGGKAQVSSRRGLVLHHLMELPESELRLFFDLVFKDLFEDEQQAGGDLFQHVLEGLEVPVRGARQMQACTEMVQVMLSKLGKLLTPALLSYLLSVITWLGAVTQQQLDSESTSPLRSLRNTIFSTLASFYSRFDEHKISDKEQSAVLKVFLWSLLPSFTTDFIHSSSGLLLLLLAWSRDKTRRGIFLLRHPDTGAGVLETITKVLIKTATNIKVLDSVLEIIHNLVKEDDSQNASEDGEKTNEGIQVVLPELETLLTHFSCWIKATNANLKSMRKVGIKLDILASIAPFITDPANALELFKQLILLSNSLKKSETVVKVLGISKLLMVHIEQGSVQEVVVDLVPFFGRLTSRGERQELGLIFEAAAKSEEALGLTAEICVELTAFDKRRVEEPDYERRMGVFKKIRNVVKEGGSLTELELNAVIYNCCWYLKHETDSSLKSNALEALVNVARLLSTLGETNPTLARNVVDKVCIAQVRTGIKHKEDGVRCDFLAFLQELVRHCGESNGRLKDLARLADPDPDIDFFENMRHVQLHRRGRAMARLAKQLGEEPGLVKQRNLTQVVLPLATVYLLTDNYSKNSQLVEQAIELVGAVNRTLPWQQYENNIKYYLELFAKEIQHQRQLVKIVTAILDAFHFDLNKGEAKPVESVSVEKDNETVEPMEVVVVDEAEKEISKDEVLRTRILNTVSNVLLPKLHATLSGKTKGPTAISDEDKLILRVPLALPIVKMLKIMSFKALQRAVPGIVSKIASFLKSKAIEVREAARATLCSVAEQLGPRYVGLVVRELAAVLQRGYQLHILTYTLHSVVHRMGEAGLLSPGDLDKCCSQVKVIASHFPLVSENYLFLFRWLRSA